MPKGVHLTLTFIIVTLQIVTAFRQPATAAPELPNGFLSDEIPISILNRVEEEDPVVTSDGKNFLVVWQTDRKNPDEYKESSD